MGVKIFLSTVGKRPEILGKEGVCQPQYWCFILLTLKGWKEKSTWVKIKLKA